MATKGIYKLDDGNCFPTNCFPARNLLRPSYKEGAGHWEVARQTAEQTKLELLFGRSPPEISWKGAVLQQRTAWHLGEKTLDGTQLIQLHHVKSPSDLCSVDVSNRNFSSAKEEDFEQFTSVAYINATENLLTLDVFRTFPELRELELSLNGLRNLKVNVGDFPHLEILDLSYNNLSPEDVRLLGALSRLKVLHLTANGLSSLPLDLAIPESGGKGGPRFPALEVLLLDDNRLSHPNVFVSLANLQSLKQLNLDRNGIQEVPYLHHVGNSRFSIHPLSAKSGIREGLRSRRNAESRLCRERPSKRRETPEYVVLRNSRDPDRTEVVFPSWSPEPPTQEEPPSPSPRPDSVPSCLPDDPKFSLPLPELRFLSLADNQIEHEEDLLAVALFPSLAEVTFHGNPFTTSRSGDPPLLTSFLQNKLGIKLVRKKISKLEKPRIFIPIKANRKVKSQLPKVQKRPWRLEARLETTFWQLWTGTDLDPHMLQPLPSIKSVVCEPSQPILPTLSSQDRSVPYSLNSSFTENDLSDLWSSIDQLQSGNISPTVSSLDQLLFGNISEAPSASEQFQPQSTAPRRSLLEEQGPRDPAAQVQRRFTEQNLEEDQPETDSASGAPAVEVDAPEGMLLAPSSPLARQGQVGPALPPQEQGLSEPLPASGSHAAEGGLSGAPPPVTSVEEPVPLLRPLLPEQLLSEAVPPKELPAEEQNVLKPPPRVASLLAEEGLSKALPSDGSPTLQVEQRESVPPVGPSPQEADWSECVSLSVWSAGPLPGVLLPDASPAGEEDWVGPSPSHSSPSGPDSLLNPPIRSLLAEQDQSQSDPSPSSLFIEQLVSQTLPPSEEPDSPGVPSVSMERDFPEEQDHSAYQKPSQEAEPQRSSTAQPQAGDLLSCETALIPKGLPAFLLPSRSSSRELYNLFAQAHLDTLQLRLDDEFLTETDSCSVGVEFPEEQKPESFFMTQVDEAPSSSLKAPKQHLREGKKKKLVLPEKYKGYEELLGGDPGPDFVEPVGIQHNVQALEKALRYPRTYREPKARLDGFQKPFAPAEKKILRVPVQKAQKTKAEQLEEILLAMRKPTNIVQIPLVCVLRRRKENWREYRKALELLKEFRKEYKATVAACHPGEKASPARERDLTADEKNLSRQLRAPPEGKGSRPLQQRAPEEGREAPVGTEGPSGREGLER